MRNSAPYWTIELRDHPTDIPNSELIMDHPPSRPGRFGALAVLWVVAAIQLAGVWRVNAASTSLIMDLSIVEADERDVVLAKFLTECTPADLPMLLELTRKPELTASRIGEVGVAIQRIGASIPWDQIEPLVSDANDVTRYYGICALRTQPPAEREARAIVLLASAHADVRARAALLLRHHPTAKSLAALRARLPEATTAAERLSINASIDWITWMNTSGGTPDDVALIAVEHDPPADGEWAAFHVPASSSALTDERWLKLVTTQVKAGATLWISAAPSGSWPAGTEALLGALGISPPRQITDAKTRFRDNFSEPTPLAEYVHDAILPRVLPPTEGTDHLYAVTIQIAEWFPEATRGFRDWDRSVFAAPFVGLEQSDVAPMLIAPRSAGHGRIILDASGIGMAAHRRRPGDTRPQVTTWQPYDQAAATLQLWETGNNFQAIVQGPQSLIPMKLLTTKVGRLQKPDERIPAPYFDVSTRIETPHIKWGDPLASGPVDVGFLAPEELIRSGIEIQQRLSVNATWLPWSEHLFFSDDARNEKRRMAEVIDAGSILRLQSHLARDMDVLVFPGLTGSRERMEYHTCWDGMLPDLQTLLLHRIRAGLGMVVLGPTWLANPAAIGATEVPVPESILAAFPFAEGSDPRALVRCYELGEGRVVHVRITHFNGWADVNLGPEFLAPGLASPRTRRLKQDEYAYSLDCAAILWAAKRQVQSAGENAEVRLADRFGRRAAAGETAGTVIRESRYLSAEGKVLGWRVERDTLAALGPLEIRFADRVIEAGMPLEITIDVPELAATDELRITVVDAWRREVTETITMTGGRARTVNVSVPGWSPLGRWHDVYVQQRREDVVVSHQMQPFAVNVARDPTDLTTILFPGPTPYAEGLVAAGVDAVGRTRFHAFQPRVENVAATEQSAVNLWDAHDVLLRHGIGSFGGAVGQATVDSSGQRPVFQPSLHSPTFHQGMRDTVAAWAEPHRLLGWPSVETMEEFVGPDSIGFSGESLVVFRRELRARYGSIAALNTAWQRDFPDWEAVVPDTLGEAVARRHLVSWSEHHAFMERAVANWQAMAERYYRQVNAKGQLSFWTPQFDSPFGLADVSLLSRACSSHFFYGGRDTSRVADMMAPGGQLGLWYPFCYDRDLAWTAAAEATQVPHSYLLDGFNTFGIWWGFEKYQWPFLRPDFTPSRNFTPLATQIPALQDGIDRLILGAEKNDHGVAIVFDQNSFRTSAALQRMTQADIQHDWQAARDILAAGQINPTMVPLADLRFGRLETDDFRVLILFGVICLDEADATAIRHFVERGGTVVADTLPGIYTATAGIRESSPLADLFGVTGSPSCEFVATGDFVGGDGLPTIPGVVFPGAGLGVQGGTARAQAGDSPAWIESRAGTGRTLLLNLQVRGSAPSRAGTSELSWSRKDQAAAWGRALIPWLAIPRSVTAELGAPRRGRSLYEFRDGDREIVGITFGLGAYEREPTPFTATVTTATPKVLYDLTGGRKARTGTEFAIDVPRWEAAYLVLCDAPLPPLACEAALGDNRTITVRLRADDPGRRIVVGRVTDPTGRERLELRSESVFVGEGELRIPIAWNEPPGTWAIAIRDRITGVVTHLEVTLP